MTFPDKTRICQICFDCESNTGPQDLQSCAYVVDAVECAASCVRCVARCEAGGIDLPISILILSVQKQIRKHKKLSMTFPDKTCICKTCFDRESNTGPQDLQSYASVDVVECAARLRAACAVSLGVKLEEGLTLQLAALF